MIKYSHVSYDWKEGGAEEEYENALKKFGLVMTDDPVTEGQDQYAYFITKGNPSHLQVREMMIDNYGKNLIEELEL